MNVEVIKSQKEMEAEMTENGKALMVKPDSDLFTPVMRVEDAVENFNTVKHFVTSIMTEGQDYGVIPGTGKKKVLLKPGAEKLATFFGLTKKFQLLDKVEDWLGEEHNKEPFFYYLYRCQLWRGDRLIAEADGSCNSWESKYRYRYLERVCPQCGEPAIKRSKYPPNNNPDAEPGWYCFKKIGGCGANFAHDDPAITEQKTGKVLNKDIADLVNTIQKMSVKRSFVACVLMAVNASEFFTQDLEDFEIIDGSSTVIPTEEEHKESPKEEVKQEKSNRETKKEQDEMVGNLSAADKWANKIITLATQAGWTPERLVGHVAKHYDIEVKPGVNDTKSTIFKMRQSQVLKLAETLKARIELNEKVNSFLDGKPSVVLVDWCNENLGKSYTNKKTPKAILDELTDEERVKLLEYITAQLAVKAEDIEDIEEAFTGEGE